MVYSQDFKLIITHALPAKGTTDRYIGLPPTYTHGRVLKLSDVKQRLSSMGEVMENYVKKLVLHKKDSTTALNALLTLKVHYYAEDIVKAVDRALRHGVYDIKAVERFLKGHARQRDAVKTLFNQIPDDQSNHDNSD